jgi:hypothetical protein
LFEGLPCAENIDPQIIEAHHSGNFDVTLPYGFCEGLERQIYSARAVLWLAELAGPNLPPRIKDLPADISGTWKGTAEGPGGTMERTFVFKVDGTALTGEAISPVFGKSAIENGKVDGDKLSFQLKVKFQNNEMTISYSGEAKGGEMTLTAKGAGDLVMEWKCRKQ